MFIMQFVAFMHKWLYQKHSIVQFVYKLYTYINNNYEYT